MKKNYIGGLTALSLVLSMWLVGCGENVATPKANEDVVSEEQSDGSHQLQLTDSSGYATQIPDGTPGEGLDEGSLDKGKGCVYIQWCNEPGPSGTICRLRKGCTYNQKTIDECIDDTYYVCGKPVYPWYIY